MLNIFFSLGSSGISEVSLLDNREVVVSLKKGNFGSLGSNNEDVLESGGELKTIFVLNVDNFVRSRVLLESLDGSNSTDVISSGDHNFSSNFEFEAGSDFVGSQVELDGVVDLDEGVGESEGSSVMSDNIRDSLGTHSSSLNSAELEFGFTRGDLGKSESTFAVIEESVVGFSLEEGDNIHESDGEFVILSDLSVDGDVTVLSKDDHLGFSSSESDL